MNTNKLLLHVPVTQRGTSWVIETGTTWVIETSHLADVPEELWAGDLRALRYKVQDISDNRSYRRGIPPMGKIQFRYEADENDCVTMVHCYFIDRRGNQKRFMRLRRADLDLST